MENKIIEYKYSDGQIQRVQQVIVDCFADFKFLSLKADPNSFNTIVDLYENYIVKNNQFAFGTLLFFTIDSINENITPLYDEKYGTIYDKQVAISVLFKKYIKLNNDKLVITDSKTKDIYEKLLVKGKVRLVKGKLNSLTILAVNPKLGYLSKNREDSSLRVNSSFFVMDKWDCLTPYDGIGTPIGLQIKDGKIINHPMFDRQGLLIKRNGETLIKPISNNDVSYLIDGNEYMTNSNICVYTRDKRFTSPKSVMDLIIVNNKIVAIKKGGRSLIPCGGLVISLKSEINIKDFNIAYLGLEDYLFGIQVGNSAVIEDQITDKFVSKFYNIINFYKPSYPPSLYPLNYCKARAPRIVLGSNADNQPVLLWFEGKGKYGYIPGLDSCGASLLEVAKISQNLGIKNAINLDGGGSAQILVNGKRYLKMSDRDEKNFQEIERAIPCGLYID